MSETVPLENLCELIVDCKNRTPPEANDHEAFAHAIGTPHIHNGRIVLRNAKPVNQETFDIWTQRAVPRENDVVLTREAPVGRVGRIEPGMKVCLGQRTMLLRPNTSIVDPTFFAYFLMSKEVQEVLHAHASGSTVPHLRVHQVRTLPVPHVPPLSRQRAIGTMLEALDDKISANERIITTGHQLCFALYEQAISQTSNITPLEEVIDLKYGKALPKSSRIPGPIPVYGSGGITGTHNEPLAAAPGIIVGRKGTIGTVYWTNKDFFPIDTTFYVALRTEKISMEFLYFTLLSLKLSDMNSDSAVPGLNRTTVLAQPIRVPGFSDLETFTRNAQSLFRRIQKGREECETLAALRDTLLPKLISGELRVKDAERAVSDAV